MHSMKLQCSGTAAWKTKLCFYLQKEFFDSDRCCHSGVKYRCFLPRIKKSHISKVNKSHELKFCYKCQNMCHGKLLEYLLWLDKSSLFESCMKSWNFSRKFWQLQLLAVIFSDKHSTEQFVYHSPRGIKCNRFHSVLGPWTW